jgi:hypothetical protein
VAKLYDLLQRDVYRLLGATVYGLLQGDICGLLEAKCIVFCREIVGSWRLNCKAFYRDIFVGFLGLRCMTFFGSCLSVCRLDPELHIFLYMMNLDFKL